MAIETLPTRLVAALQAAGLELHTGPQGWGVRDDGDTGEPEADGYFVSVVGRHILPLLDERAFRSAEIAELEAEIAAKSSVLARLRAEYSRAEAPSDGE